MEKIIWILSLIAGILISCCSSDTPGSVEAWQNKSLTCEGELIECKQELSGEGFKWQQEFECDRWEQTGVTLYKNGRCKEYRLFDDGNWYSAEDLNDMSLEEWRNFRDRYDTIQYIDLCEQVPYQEKVCAHKKVVGLKKK